MDGPIDREIVTRDRRSVDDVVAGSVQLLLTMLQLMVRHYGRMRLFFLSTQRAWAWLQFSTLGRSMSIAHARMSVTWEIA